MKIEVKVREVELGKTIGFADVTLDGKFVIKGLKIIQGNKGNFVAMPSIKLNKPYTDKKTGEEILYQDIFFPITKDARQELQDAVLGAFDSLDDSPF